MDLTLTAPDGRVLFSHRELADPESASGRLAPGFGDRLIGLRLAFARPMLPTSACRTAVRNAHIGGHPRSLHVYDVPAHPTGGTCAVDFAMRSVAEGLALAAHAWEHGFSIGINFSAQFVHVDDRTRVLGLPQAAFTY